MKYRIGLDIGIASVGGCAMECDENGEPVRILDLSVRIFDKAEDPQTGASLALPCRTARGMRRRLRRRAHRLERVRRLCLEQFGNDVLQRAEANKEDIFRLRFAGLSETLRDEELTRVLIYFAKRRGFRSNRKSEGKDKDTGKMLKAVRENETYMQEKGYATVGEMLYRDPKYFEIVEGRKIYHTRNGDGDYGKAFAREDIRREAEAILARQAEGGLVDRAFAEKYLGIFSSQRSFDEGPASPSPYRLEGYDIGNCIFLPTEKRAPKASYTFEYGTALQKINNLKVIDGTFDKVIVLLNTGNPLQMKDLAAYYDGIDACMWIGQPGSTGINAIADLLKGKDMEGNDLAPSGRLTDTWAYDNNSAPAAVNDGNYMYGNTDLMSSKLKNNLEYHGKYIVYQEGIYVGYRYYETRYADLIAGEGNAASTKGAKNSSGAWNYDEEVAFPFGYGISYTDFSYKNFSVEEDGDNYVAKVTVKNEGSVTAKEVVQVYLQKPYTADDKANGVEKSAVELVGYDKTQPLGPDDEETVTISVPKEYFKTYDANGQETYIIEQGDYYLTVATDAHVAINNILAFGGKTVSQAVMGGAANTKDVDLGAGFVEKLTLAQDYTTYSVSTQTGEDIYNRLDSGDINKYQNKGTNSVTWLSRGDWDKTYPTQAPTLTLNVQMAMDLDYDREPDDTYYDMPEYEVFASGSTDGTPDVKSGDLVAYQFMNAPLYPENEKDKDEVYNEEDGLTYADWEDRWNQLLDQMSFEEQVYMVVNSYHWIQGATSVSLPTSRQENGPVGITKRTEAFFSLPNDETIKGANGTGWTYVAYPCAGIIAASFNNEIAEMIGEHKSEDMLYLGYNGIYGPGVNLHRSPYGGRAFEYPSEDPFLAGMIEAHECIGIESKGCLAYAKHFALNDMETNRVNCGIWCNEQTSREIYLRAFEIVFTEGGASATMNSFTRLGTTWFGASYEVMTEILRGEWGYDGLVISDWDTKGSAMSKVDGVMAGTDTFDGNNSVDVLMPYADNAAVAQAVRLAVKRVIYNVVRTNVMNGMTISSITIKVTPWWKTCLLALECTFGALTVVSAGMLITSFVLSARKKGETA